jgi:pimeloyl-ACP methyl ester carboxylesterase
MKNGLKYIALSAAAVILAGCGSSDGSGNVQSAKVVDNVPAATMLQVIKSNIDSNASVAFGYKAVKLTYTTTTPDGKEVEASGIMVIPEGFPAPLSVVVDNHGTIFKDSEAPSNTEIPDGLPNLPTAVLFSGYAGFVTVMPDYLGYGASKGETHPYIMTYSAKASIDMLNAAEKYLKENNYTVTNDVYITGYSEGGYVAMEMAKELQDENTTYNIKAAAPMAGPYDIEKLGIFDLNDSNKMVFPAFLAYIADSYTKIYGYGIDNIVDKPEVFKNYNLFGGDYDAVAIHYYLGLTDLAHGDYGFYTHYPHELFKEDFLNDFETNPQNFLREKLNENNNYAWVPNFPMNIINCQDDEIIPAVVAQEANATMNAMGAKAVSLTLIPSSMIEAPSAEKPFVHQRCAPVAYGAAAKFFTTVRGY